MVTSIASPTVNSVQAQNKEEVATQSNIHFSARQMQVIYDALRPMDAKHFDITYRDYRYRYDILDFASTRLKFAMSIPKELEKIIDGLSIDIKWDHEKRTTEVYYTVQKTNKFALRLFDKKEELMKKFSEIHLEIFAKLSINDEQQFKLFLPHIDGGLHPFTEIDTCAALASRFAKLSNKTFENRENPKVPFPGGELAWTIDKIKTHPLNKLLENTSEVPLSIYVLRWMFKIGEKIELDFFWRHALGYSGDLKLDGSDKAVAPNLPLVQALVDLVKEQHGDKKASQYQKGKYIDFTTGWDIALRPLLEACKLLGQTHKECLQLLLNAGVTSISASQNSDQHSKEQASAKTAAAPSTK